MYKVTGFNNYATIEQLFQSSKVAYQKYEQLKSQGYAVKWEKLKDESFSDYGKSLMRGL